MTPHEILLFGDGSHLLRTIGWVLEYKGFRVRAAASPEAALEALVRKNFDLVISRVTLSEPDGIEVIKRAKALNHRTRVMAISGNGELTFPLEAYEVEVDDYLMMPLSPLELCRRVSAVLDNKPRPAQTPAGRRRDLNSRVWSRLMLMAHDIRGGLVSTDAALKLLLRGNSGPVAEPMAAKLKEMSARLRNLTRLTEDFLNRAASGSAVAGGEEEPLDLQKDVVSPVLREFSGELRDQEVTIDNRLSASPAAAAPVKGSRAGLQSVFRNLLANGIKYGGRGCTIAIDLETRGGHWRLKVYNSGRPVPEEYRARLFTPKSRRSRREEEGLGLGLSLSRDLVQNHGGDLWYEAKVDGSNFVVSLPQT
jgi:signal transduction histidine kinase